PGIKLGGAIYRLSVPTAATGFFPSALICRYRNSGDVVCADTVSTLLFCCAGSSQLRSTCTATGPGVTAGISTVICVVATAKIGARTVPKVTHTPANFMESWPSATVLIAGGAPAAMKFEP